MSDLRMGVMVCVYAASAAFVVATVVAKSTDGTAAGGAAGWREKPRAPRPGVRGASGGEARAPRRGPPGCGGGDSSDEADGAREGG